MARTSYSITLSSRSRVAMTVSLDFRTLYCNILSVLLGFMSQCPSRCPYAGCWYESGCCFREPRAPPLMGWQPFVVSEHASSLVARFLYLPVLASVLRWSVLVLFLVERCPWRSLFQMTEQVPSMISSSAAFPLPLVAECPVQEALVPDGIELLSRMLP